jgi:hypothetical protein
MNKNFELSDLLGLLVISLLILTCVSIFYSLVKDANQKYVQNQVLEQLDSRTKDDNYIKSHIHYGKDQFGNCWVWGSNSGLVSIECSKIGRQHE